MNNEREVTFRITEDQTDSSYVILVQPCLRGISRENGGDRILLAIAVNCVRMVAHGTGLEAAVDQFNDLVVNHAHLRRQSTGDQTDDRPPSPP